MWYILFVALGMSMAMEIAVVIHLELAVHISSGLQASKGSPPGFSANKDVLTRISTSQLGTKLDRTPTDRRIVHHELFLVFQILS